MRINECKVKCPVHSEFYAYIEFNHVQNDFIVYGYIRNCWESQEFKNIINLPDVIIKLIQSYIHYNEMIHLFGKRRGSHWKINIDQIIPSTNDIA